MEIEEKMYADADGWSPGFKKGYSVLDTEDGFFYWIFQVISLPPVIVFVVLIFGIIACVRGQVCICCRKKSVGNIGNVSLVRQAS